MPQIPVNRSARITDALVDFAKVDPKPGGSPEWETLYREATQAAWEADMLRRVVVEMLISRRAVEAAHRVSLPTHEAAALIVRAERADATAFLATLPDPD